MRRWLCSGRCVCCEAMDASARNIPDYFFSKVSGGIRTHVEEYLFGFADRRLCHSATETFVIVVKGRVELPRPYGHEPLKLACLPFHHLTFANSPYGNRTHLSGMRGRYPEPIDERASYSSIGVTGFEPAIFWSQTRRPTRLGHTPELLIRVRMINKMASGIRTHTSILEESHARPFDNIATLLFSTSEKRHRGELNPPSTE